MSLPKKGTLLSYDGHCYKEIPMDIKFCLRVEFLALEKYFC